MELIIKCEVEELKKLLDSTVEPNKGAYNIGIQLDENLTSETIEKLLRREFTNSDSNDVI